jgi:hypothetical protein
MRKKKKLEKGKRGAVDTGARGGMRLRRILE